MRRKEKNSQAGIPSQEVCPQVERYTGSDVIGMEETTARPMFYETGADPAVFLPGKPSTFFDRRTMRFKSHTDEGHKGEQAFKPENF